MLKLLAALAFVLIVYFAVRGWRRLSRLPLTWAERFALLNGSVRWDLMVGSVIGAIAIAIVVAALGAAVSGQAVSAHALSLFFWSVYFVFFAVIEEIVFRVLLLTGLRIVLSSDTRAIFVGAVLFGVGHGTNPHAGYLSVLGSTIGGVAYGIAYVRSRSLWLPIGMHFSWNFVQGIVFGLPVSGLQVPGLLHTALSGPLALNGGAYGLEGGQAGLCARVIVLALLALFLFLRHESLRGRPTLTLERGSA
jgi:uncharacterized protein